MRTLVLSQYFWPEGFQINDIVKTMASRGEDVEVLTGKPNYPQGKVFPGYHSWGLHREIFQGVPIHRIPMLARGRGGISLAINYLSFVIGGLIFAPWLLRGKKFDVIFVYAPSPILQAIPALFLGWIKGCPVVLWVQDLWPESLSATGHVKNKLILKLVEKVVRFIYRHTDLLLVQSEAFIGPVSELAAGTPVQYHPNSADESFTTDCTLSLPEVPGLGKGFSILFAGNIGSAQAIDVIVEAASLLRDTQEIQFCVLGDGSRRQSIMQEVTDRGLSNVHFPGRFPVETMPGFMRKASVLLVTLADQEIFRLTVPSKVQAYLASGRPILACLNGEGAKIVDDAGAGMTVPAGDAKALAEAALHMYRMTPQERDVMGANGRSYHMKNFSHDMLVNRLTALLARRCSEGEKI